MGCAFWDISCHASGLFWGAVNAVPWWVWGLALLTAAGAVWKFAGWPGIIALAAGIAFMLGRRSSRDDIFPDDDPKPVRRPKPKPGKPTGWKPKTLLERLTGRPE